MNKTIVFTVLLSIMYFSGNGKPGNGYFDYHYFKSYHEAIKYPDSVNSLTIQHDTMVSKYDYSVFKNLTSINLIYTGIKRLPSSLFKCKKLWMIEAGDNLIDSIQHELTSLPVLTWLRLSYNHITEIPDFIKEIHSLRSIDIQGNRLTKIPAVLEECKNLEFISIGGDPGLNIQDAFKTVCKIGKLQHIEIYGCKIDSFPTELGNLKKLNWFALYKDTLHNLKDLFTILGNLPNLKNLIIADCGLKRIPGNISELKNLQGLCLYSNNLRNIPKELAQIKHLGSLDLYGNRISKHRQKEIEKMLPKAGIAFEPPMY